MWIQYLWYKLPHIYIKYLKPVRISSKKRKNTDADTMDGDTLLWVTHEAYVSHGQLLTQQTTSNMASVKHMSHQIDFGFF